MPPPSPAPDRRLPIPVRVIDAEGQPVPARLPLRVVDASAATLWSGTTEATGTADLPPTAAPAWLVLPTRGLSLPVPTDPGPWTVRLPANRDARAAAALRAAIPSLLLIGLPMLAAGLLPDPDAVSVRPRPPPPSERELPPPEWHIWPEDNAARVTIEGRKATLHNPAGADARDSVTACFDGERLAWRTGRLEGIWTVTSATEQGMGRVFGKVMVPGESPHVKPLGTTHATTPPRKVAGVVDVLDDAKAVQLCGAVHGPDVELTLEVPVVDAP